MKTLLISILAITVAGCTSTSQRPLTDSEIAMIMRVVNLSEAREGQLARDKATDPAVRDFAAAMFTEHTAQNSKAESELAKVDIPSEDTDLSRKLMPAAHKKAVREQLKELRTLVDKHLARAKQIQGSLSR
jgi:putative membrane protein